MKVSISNQLKGELFSLLYGYPHFIYAKNPDFLTNEIPVFVFHTIDPIIFEEQLIFLKDNGYRTLGVNEFVDCLAKKKNTIEKPVLLTVDDGRSSFYRFGYPLLQKYNMRATLFILPGWILDANNVRNNLLEVWKSEINLAQLSAIDPKDETLCTWPEIKEMYASGIVDIENHTLFHKEVFVSPKLVGFIKKNTSFTPYNTPVTAYLGKENINQELTPAKIIGLPLFESAPLLGAHPAIKVPENLIAACKKSYNEFKSDRHPNSDWNKKLKKLVDQYPASSMPCQTKEEMLKDIITDI
ncbi:polysaccharide deacetylase family protein, partial [bacterium]|nr:polysaccharide deacetylase family protein [bacterium]